MIGLLIFAQILMRSPVTAEVCEAKMLCTQDTAARGFPCMPVCVNLCVMRECKPDPKSLSRWCVFRLGKLIVWTTSKRAARQTAEDCPARVTRKMMEYGYPDSGMWKEEKK